MNSDYSMRRTNLLQLITHRIFFTPGVQHLLSLIIIPIILCFSPYGNIQAQEISDIPVWTGNQNAKVVRDYNTVIKKIYALSDEYIKVMKAGSIYDDDIEYPVFALSYTPPEPPVIRVFLAAGQHGNEPATADAVIDFFHYIREHISQYRDIAVDAIPMINPWGWVNNTRFNSNWRDTNRDYYKFSTPEARIVRDFVRDRSYDFMIDHHESPADGAFIFNYDEDMFEISNNLMDFLRTEGYGIGKKGYFTDRTLINGIMDVPTRRKTYTTNYISSRESYWRENSTIVRFFINSFDAYGFTMETSTNKLYKYRVECHFDVMKFMINAFRTHFQYK